MNVKNLYKKALVHERLHPWRARAIRECISFMPPVILAGLGIITPFQAMIGSFSAHSICMMDIHGSYRHKISIMALLGIVMISMSWAGTMVGRHILPALALAIVLALLSGAFRLFLKEYGPGIATPAALMLFTAMAAPPDAHADFALSIAAVSTAGSIWGTFLCVYRWPFDRYYPLRYAVGQCWLAIAELAEALTNGNSDKAFKKKAALQMALSRGQKTLLSTHDHKMQGYVAILHELLDSAATFGVKLPDPGVSPRDGGQESPDAVISATIAKSVALAITSPSIHHYREARKQLQFTSRQYRNTLSEEQKQEATFCFKTSIEALRQLVLSQKGKVSNLDTISSSKSGNKNERTPALQSLHLQYSVCLALVLAVGTAIFIGFKLPHGYWIPFSSLVVLQPELLQTRSKAVHRCCGTLLGCLAVSCFLLVDLPYNLHLCLLALLSGGIAYLIKRHYGSGIFIVTMLVVLQMQTVEPIGFNFLFERLLCCTMGSVLAFIAVWFLKRPQTGQRISAFSRLSKSYGR